MLDLKAHIMLQGGQERINKQHAKGKLTARERVDLLFDPGTFVEYNMFVKPRATRFGMDKVDAPADGIVTGHGLINGRRAFVYSQDATVLGGSMGEMHGLKLARMQELALEAGVPIIGLNDSGGGRLQEGPGASVYGTVFYNNVNSSGVIPQISAIMGSCAGGACYSPALTDFVIMVDKSSKAFITGPKVIQQVTGEVVDLETLGGAATHSTKSGLCQLVARDDYDCIAQIKCLLSFFPDNCTQMPPVYQCGDDVNRRIEELNDIIPDNKRRSYDMKSIITKIADDNFFFEISPMYARNIIIGFVRMGGMPVGVVANQTGCMAGCLDINASCKRPAGARRHHPPRREDALRVGRGDRAEDNHADTQVLRRSDARDVQHRHARRLRHGVADLRARRRRSGRGRRRALQERDRAGCRPRGCEGDVQKNVRGRVPQPLPLGRARKV